METDEIEIASLADKHLSLYTVNDMRHEGYYEGTRRLDHLGISVPPELQMFETYLNWGRVALDWIVNRQEVRTLLAPDGERVSTNLMEHYDSNNLAAELPLFNLDKLVYGRSFLSVGTNEEDKDHPFIRVESPREIYLKVNPRTMRAEYAARFYGEIESPAGLTRSEYATLYFPDKTIWLERTTGGRWFEVDRDNHRLGRVPVIMSLNRRRTGVWSGVSELVDIIPILDATTRNMTGLQLAQETMAVPRRGVLGATKGDFIDPKTGEVLTTWQVYTGAVWALANKEAKTFQFDAAELSNFSEIINMYAQQAATVTGIPVKTFGQTTANPASEGAIRAEEGNGVKRVERQNTDTGTALSWAIGLAEMFRSGKMLEGTAVKVEWHDPATPTFAQRADALQKLHGGGAILSREGVWDELGFSEARKKREREYFKQEEQADPYLDRLLEKERENDPASIGAAVPSPGDPEQQGDPSGAR